VVRGKLLSKSLLSKSLLFDMALAEACTAAGLVDSAGKATITAHRFLRHTIGTQLAEGGARIQTIMAVLGHRTPNMAIIYANLSDPTVKQQYQDASTATSTPTSPSPDQLPTRCVSTASTPKRCPGCRPTSSRPNSNSATAYPPQPKDRANATSCSPARSSSPPATMRPGSARVWPSSSNSSTTPPAADGTERSNATPPPATASRRFLAQLGSRGIDQAELGEKP